MRYKEVAERLAGDILKRRRPGERLPGIRELAIQENISHVTARNVYQYLLEKGLVISRQGSGTFVSYGSAGSIIDMATIRPPEELLLWVGPHLNITLEGLHTYDPPQGYEPLRMQAMNWLSSLGIHQTPIITAGSQQALFLVGLSLIKRGDVVAVEDPGYRGAARIFESLGAVVIPVHYISSIEDLDRLHSLDIRILYSMPQGLIPTGKSIPEGLRDRLLQLAHKRDFFIIEDDPLSEVMGATPLKARDMHERVIYIKSLSNILGPGLRIGFTVVPGTIYNTIIQLKEINDLSLSGILQRCLSTMLSSSNLKDHVRRLKIELQSRSDYLSHATSWATGGPCLWIKTSVPSRISCEKLLSLGVRVTPGDIYGAQWSDYIRLSVLTPSRMNFERAVGIVQEYLKGTTGPDLTEF
ncbi:MAG TPA: PLP-dependent aminotransferase family protein [Desulfomonilia bacterium]|nr:PLP-dependent aminotransferase family protein [Desulfomonilia bacterium]